MIILLSLVELKPESRITNLNEEILIYQLTLYLFSNDGQLLHIINVIGLDQGTYKCATRNDYGSDEASEYVDVLSKWDTKYIKT